MIKPKGKFRDQRVAVLMGGPSGEREVSLRSGKAIVQALKEKGYDVFGLDPDQGFVSKLKDQGIQVVYNALHGTWGEDGLVQGILETAQIPYTGSGVTSSALTMDKELSKRCLLQAGLPTPQFIALDRCVQSKEFSAEEIPFDFPVVVKPNCDGSSLGISICKKPEDLPRALKAAFERDDQILIEEFIEGRELTVGLVGELAFPLVEIVPNREFYDYEAKYTPGGSNYYCPAEIDKARGEHLQEISLQVQRLFRCRGGIRVDFRFNSKQEGYILEVNTSPGMTELSLLPMGAKQAGLSFADLVELILDGAKVEGCVLWGEK